jgi:phosphinothricin acetyltransferase
MEITVRKAKLSDLDGITEIYNDAILKTAATFDTDPKTHIEQMEWFKKHDERYPVLISVLKGEVIGWASLSRWSDRCAYADTGEISIYIKESFRGKGVGKQLFDALVKTGKEVKLHTLVSRIAGESAASIKLHEQFGFFHIGTMKEVGRKFGKLLDVHLMQKIL